MSGFRNALGTNVSVCVDIPGVVKTFRTKATIPSVHNSVNSSCKKAVFTKKFNLFSKINLFKRNAFFKCITDHAQR